MLRIVVLFSLLAGVLGLEPAAAQDCFPYATTTRLVGEVSLTATPVCLVAEGTLTCVVTATHLICLDTADLAHPAVLGQVAHGVTPRCGARLGNLLVIGTTTGLRVFDVSDPSTPVARGSAIIAQPVEDLAVGEDLLLAAAGAAGLQLFEVSAAGYLQAVGVFETYSAIHGVAPRGPHRVLVAAEEVLLDLDVADPQAPVVLQELYPSTLPENWPFFFGVEVFGDLAVVAIQEALPVARGSRDWGDANTLLLLDLATLDPDHLVRGYWSGNEMGDLHLDDLAADRLVAHDGERVLMFTLAAPPVRPSAWSPLVVLEAGTPVAGAALTGGGVAVAVAPSSLRMLLTDDPVVVPTTTRFAPGEEVVLAGDGWAYSYTPHGNYQDTGYLYSLWDLREPLAPALVQTVACQAGFEFGHSCAVEACAGDLVLRVDHTADGSSWSLQDWSASGGTSVPLATVRSAAVFAGDLLLTLGADLAHPTADPGIEVVDVANPAAPVVRGFLRQGSLAIDANLVLGNRWLTGLRTQWADSLLVVDLSDPDAPARADALAVTGRTRYLWSHGDLVVAADWDGDLWVYGLDPLRVVGHLAGDPPIRGVAIDDGVAWVLWSSEGLVGVDLSDPASPVRRGAVAVTATAGGVVVKGDVAYVATGEAGVQAYDVSDADVPEWLGGGGAEARVVRDGGNCLVLPGAVVPLDCRSLVATPGAVPVPSVPAISVAPNPFNPRVVVRFALPRAGRAELGVYDLRGRRVCELWRGEQAAGHQDVIWDGTDAAGREQPSGVYLVQLRTDQGTTSQKVTLAR